MSYPSIPKNAAAAMQPPEAMIIAQQRQRECILAQRKKLKEGKRIVIHVRVLIKYLGEKHEGLHGRALAVIRDCARRKKRRERGYESLPVAMNRELRELVGEHYWKKSKDLLETMYRKSQARRQRKQQQQEQQTAHEVSERK